MKKIILSIFLLLGGIFLVSCKNNEVDFTSKESVFAISAVTGVNEAISNSEKDNTNSIEESNEEILTEENVELPEEDQNELEFVLNLINKDVFKVLEKESDIVEYNNLLEITFNNETYKFYFNEILIEENDDDDDEIEEEYIIKGIVLYNELEFSVLGNKELEIEDDEEEIEIELIIALNESNYTKVKYETELETDEFEKKYKVETYENNKKVSEFEFEFEIEDNKLKSNAKFNSKNKNVWYEIRGNDKNNQANVVYHSLVNGVKTKHIFKVNVIIEGNNASYEYIK